MAQLVTRIDDALLERLDRLVADGEVPSRSDAVRRGLDHLLQLSDRRRRDDEIVAAYTRMPQTGDEFAGADAATAAMIAAEPWD